MTDVILTVALWLLAIVGAGSLARLAWQLRTALTAWAERRWNARYHRPVIHAYHRPLHRRTA